MKATHYSDFLKKLGGKPVAASFLYFFKFIFSKITFLEMCECEHLGDIFGLEVLPIMAVPSVLSLLLGFLFSCEF